MNLCCDVEIGQQKIVISATIYSGTHMVGTTKKTCYGTFHVKVGVICNHVVIFAPVSGILLIVIHKPKIRRNKFMRKQKHLTLRILLGVGVFGCGSTLALASMGSPMATQQQPSSPAMQSGQGTLAPKMSVQPPGPKVGHAELHHFAAAIISVQPINREVHRDLATQKMTQTQHQQLIKTYTQKVKTVLAKNHLSPVAYETLIKKAQTDPAFAQRVETAIKAHGG